MPNNTTTLAATNPAISLSTRLPSPSRCALRRPAGSGATSRQLDAGEVEEARSHYRAVGLEKVGARGGDMLLRWLDVLKMP